MQYIASFLFSLVKKTRLQLGGNKSLRQLRYGSESLAPPTDHVLQLLLTMSDNLKPVLHSAVLGACLEMELAWILL